MLLQVSAMPCCSLRKLHHCFCCLKMAVFVFMQVLCYSEYLKVHMTAAVAELTCLTCSNDCCGLPSVLCHCLLSAAWEQTVDMCLAGVSWYFSLCLSQPTFMVLFVAEGYNEAHEAARLMLLNVCLIAFSNRYKTSRMVGFRLLCMYIKATCMPD